MICLWVYKVFVTSKEKYCEFFVCNIVIVCIPLLIQNCVNNRKLQFTTYSKCKEKWKFISGYEYKQYSHTHCPSREHPSIELGKCIEIEIFSHAVNNTGHLWSIKYEYESGGNRYFHKYLEVVIFKTSMVLSLRVILTSIQSNALTHDKPNWL